MIAALYLRWRRFWARTLPPMIARTGASHDIAGAPCTWGEEGGRLVRLPLRCFVPFGTTCEHGITARLVKYRRLS